MPSTVRILALAAALVVHTPVPAADPQPKPRLALEAALDAPTSENAFRAFLATLPRVSLPHGTRYVFEGDLLLTEDQVRTFLSRSRARAQVLRGDKRPELIVNEADGRPDFWAGAEQRKLTYAIDRRSFAPAHYEMVKRELGSATAAWVDACTDCGISFSHRAQLDEAPSVGAATFIVRGVDSGGRFIAAAFFPSWPASQRFLYIDSTYFTTNFDRVGVLRHELGHVLGYRHEHTRGVAGCFYEDGRWFALTPYDPASVMHYPCGGGGSQKLELTPVDIAGHRKQYGSKMQASALAPREDVEVLLKLEGGAVESNLFGALAILAQQQQLHARPVTVREGQDYCQVVRNALNLPDRISCSDGTVDGLWSSLNPTANNRPWALQPGQRVLVPDRVDIHAYAFTRATEDSKAPGGVDKKVAEGYSVSVESKNPAKIPSAMGELGRLKSESFFADQRGWSQTVKGGAKSFSASKYVLSCKATAPPPEMAYAEAMLAAKVPDCAAKRCNGKSCAPIVMVDKPVAGHPKLYRALGGKDAITWPRPNECVGLDWNVDFHGTHMAGIMSASHSDAYGMAGLSPASRLWAYPLPDERIDDKLADFLNHWTTNSSDFPGTKIFLFASEFVVDALVPTKYRNPEERFTASRTSKLIRDNHDVLLVAAAGHADKSNLAQPIASATKTYPMNLGDLPNVVVVTACTDCNGKPELMARANYGESVGGRAPVVHLAAPGGDPVPGIATERASDVALAPGTSQAAAFVAGTAAALYNCHPDTLNTGPKIKRRLMVTSRPNVPKHEHQYIAAGVLDYDLALKDPVKSWYVPAGKSDRMEVAVEGWCIPRITANYEGAAPRILDTVDIRRLYFQQVEGSRGHWVIYVRDPLEGILKHVPVRLDPATRLLKVSGLPTPFLGTDTIADLLLAEREIPVVDCRPGT